MNSIDLIPIIEAAGTAVLALIAVAVAVGIRWVNGKVKSSLVDRALTAVTQACHLAVTQTWTTYVEELKAAKADGTLTDLEKRLAREKALKAAKGYLGSKGIALVVRGLGIESDWLDSFLGASIESGLADLRRRERSSGGDVLEVCSSVLGQAANHDGCADPTPASA